MAKEKNLTTVTSIAMADSARLVTSAGASVKATVQNVADAILPTLAKTVSNGTDADTISTIGCYYGTWTNQPSDASSSGYLIVLPHGAASATYKKQIYTPYGDNILYMRTMSGGTWTNWFKQPTRAEIDALNSKTGTFELASEYSGGAANLSVMQAGKVVTINGYISGVSIPATTSTVLGSIRGVSMPPAQIRARGAVGPNAYTTGADAYVGITTSGSVSIYGASAGTAVYFGITYIAN